MSSDRTALAELPAIESHLSSEDQLAARRLMHSRLKRAVDICLAAVMMLLALPVGLLIALGIKLDDHGPVFYRQKRWGPNGLFDLLKFRTMVPHSDVEFGIKQAIEDDPRVTRMGRILRATGLDELPQTINILLGQMSFVGPRALAVGEVVAASDGTPIGLDYEGLTGFALRMTVRPGLTGLATIYLPRDASPAEKFEVDARYIREWSFWWDLKLIFLSFWISLRGKWETRADKVRTGG